MPFQKRPRKPARPQKFGSHAKPPGKKLPTTETPDSKKKSRATVARFPGAWLWLVDEIIPTLVKSRYSPRESWKDKPFDAEDARFFSKGVGELSELFTDERPSELPDYFAHPKFRSSYLLYFLPLQAAKFVSLLDMHPEALDATLQHGDKSGTLNVIDLGAGPGTASLALIVKLLDRALALGRDVPKVEFDWYDTNGAILEDGKLIMEQLCGQFPKLRGRVTVRTHVMPWWKILGSLPKETSLVLMGNVLNENKRSMARTQGPASNEEDGLTRARSAEIESTRLWTELLARAKGGGILLVEPASRRSSQVLSGLRDQLFENQFIPAEATSLWGPCLHAGRCPLAEGRDWCHFSVPIDIPGKWFKNFSERLGSERQWAKFSYLWLASPSPHEGAPAPKPKAGLRRVVSDPLGGWQSKGPSEVLLCEPEQTVRMPVRAHEQIRRGDLVTPRKPAPNLTPKRFKKDQDEDWDD